MKFNKQYKAFFYAAAVFAGLSAFNSNVDAQVEDVEASNSETQVEERNPDTQVEATANASEEENATPPSQDLKESDRIAAETPVKTSANISSDTDSREQITDDDPTFKQIVTPTTEDSFPLTVEDAEKEGSRFSIAVLPDTQFYSRYATEEEGDQFNDAYGSEPFKAQTQWIADHADEYNIQMTLHVGDVVDQANRPNQWKVADEAMSVLEDNDQPYLIVAGNHDIGGQSDENGVSEYYGYYTDVFSGERAAQNSTFAGRGPSDAHEYHIFNVDGQDFLALGLSWGADDQELAWAEAVLQENSNLPTILVSHQLINNDTTTSYALKTPFGEKVWDRLIAPHDQVFLTYNGHHHGSSVVERENQYGNTVYQVLTDQQMAYMGGNGYMALTEFDLTNGKIHQTTFSPWVPQKPEDTLNAYDDVFLYDDGATFTLDFDFQERFPDLHVGDPDPSYSSQLRHHFNDTFEPVGDIELRPAADESDYPVVEGTVAHWRMNGPAGQAVEVGGEIEDVSNPENNFYRAPLNDGVQLGGSQLEDVTWSDDHHPLSSNFGSVRFVNGSRPNSEKDYHTASFFRTQEGAPINMEDFENGYTFETFIKIDENYNPDGVNDWMQWLVREGERQNVDNYDGSEGEEPPFAWAFSNLSEVQFSVLDSTENPREGSAWSGELVDYSQWYHLATVNDPEDQSVTMYVNGVPILRNSTDQIGVANDNNKPWRLGGSMYGGVGEHGFIGWIGETRLVDRPLDQSEWLISRANPIDDGDENDGDNEASDRLVLVKDLVKDPALIDLAQNLPALQDQDFDLYDIYYTDQDGNRVEEKLGQHAVQLQVRPGQQPEQVIYLGEDFEFAEDLPFQVDDGMVSFQTPSFSYFALVYNPAVSEDEGPARPDSQDSQDSQDQGQAEKLSASSDVAGVTKTASSSDEESDSSQDEDALPQTGINSSLVLAGTTILAGLGMVSRRKRP